MARPLRRLYEIPRTVRRRHRTWVLSMTLATAAMAVWSFTLIWMRIAPSSAPSLQATFAVSSLFALPGFLLGVLTIRSRLSWFLFALVPLVMNGMFLLLPWLMLGR